MLELKQVTIIGTGLLGTSLALALRDGGYGGRIVGVGRRQETLKQAQGLGCFDELTTIIVDALAEAQAMPGESPHLAVLAAPLGHFQEIFSKVALCDDPGLVVTDVGSTKVSVCEMAEQVLPDATRFVGSHPMAGSEQQGPAGADGALFKGKPCVVTPTAKTEERAIELVKDLWRGVGMDVLEMEPAKHDRNVALVSHLPHAVASMLVKVVTDDGGDALSVASTGFASTTRVAAGNPVIWVDIFQTNRDAVVESVDKMMEELTRFKKVMARGDSGALKRLLAGAKQERDEWGASRGEQG